MNKEIVEKLKDKTYVRAFGLMSPEEQDIYESAGPQNCLILCQLGHNPRDYEWCNNEMDFLAGYRTYAIKPDYQPEPEFVDLEIVKELHTFGKKCLIVLGCICTEEDIFIPLHELPSLPNFEGFYTDKYPMGQLVEYQRISYRINVEKKKVFARFRRYAKQE